MQVINQIVFFFIFKVTFVGPYTAISVGEYRFVDKSRYEPAVGIDGQYVKDPDEELSSKERFKKGATNLILWCILWMPNEYTTKVERALVGIQDDEVEVKKEWADQHR